MVFGVGTISAEANSGVWGGTISAEANSGVWGGTINNRPVGWVVKGEPYSIVCLVLLTYQQQACRQGGEGRAL